MEQTQPFQATNPAPVRLILDTDMLTDCDDAAALAMLHALAERGEVQILATVVSSRYPQSAAVVSAINTYFGRPDLPVGAPKHGAGAYRDNSSFLNQVAAEFPHPVESNDSAPDAVQVLRRCLQAEADGAVKLLTIGYLSNLANLLNSPPDEISPLSGAELAARKVNEWICMGGNFPLDDASDNVNFTRDPGPALEALRNWPGAITFVGREIGHNIFAGDRLKDTPANNPVRRAYQLHRERFNLGHWDHHTADPCAVLYAVRGLRDYWDAQEGWIDIREDCSFTWQAGGSRAQRYLLQKMERPALKRILEDLMVYVNPYQPTPFVKLKHPEWSKNAVIYQINTRQFTTQGTLRAAEEQLPRLKDLGVDLLWLMPVQPIGLKNRKGSLGSPYAVRDYYQVNPELGTLADLQHFVSAAHALGLYVILDWVANHSAWDCPLVDEHPEWYARDWNGDLHPTPWVDWQDVIDFDYRQEGLRRYMTGALQYWVRAADIDGYRCDVAGFLPTEFWNQVRRELDAIKPVFLLAEWENRDLHAEAFDMTYAWSWNEALHSICMGQAGLNRLYDYYGWNEKAFPQDGYRMLFVSNHDKNAWEGTEFEQFGNGLEAAIVLSVLSEGMPLIYNGQEAGNPRRLAFFERDPIAWREHPLGALYKQLFALKKAYRPLWNGRWGARMIQAANSAPEQVFSFVRQDDQHKLLTVINFSAQPAAVRFSQRLCHGAFADAFSRQPLTLDGDAGLSLPPWGYRVLVAARGA